MEDDEEHGEDIVVDGAGVEWALHPDTGWWWWRDDKGKCQDKGRHYTPHAKEDEEEKEYYQDAFPGDPRRRWPRETARQRRNRDRAALARSCASTAHEAMEPLQAQLQQCYMTMLTQLHDLQAEHRELRGTVAVEIGLAQAAFAQLADINLAHCVDIALVQASIADLKQSANGHMTKLFEAFDSLNQRLLQTRMKADTQKKHSPCRFIAQGRCEKGAACSFSHDVKMEIKHTRSRVCRVCHPAKRGPCTFRFKPSPLGTTEENGVAERSILHLMAQGQQGGATSCRTSARAPFSAAARS